MRNFCTLYRIIHFVLVNDGARKMPHCQHNAAYIIKLGDTNTTPFESNIILADTDTTPFEITEKAEHK